VSLDVTPFSLVGRYECFGRIRCLHLQISQIWELEALLERRVLSSGLYIS